MSVHYSNRHSWKGTYLDIDGDWGLNTTNDRVKHAVRAVNGVGSVQNHYITGVGNVIRNRDGDCERSRITARCILTSQKNRRFVTVVANGDLDVVIGEFGVDTEGVDGTTEVGIYCHKLAR